MREQMREFAMPTVDSSNDRITKRRPLFVGVEVE